MSDSPIELIAVQPHMQLADYRTVDAFDAKIAELTDRIAAARERDAHGRFRLPALVVFPEHIGTFLSIAGYGDLAAEGDDVDAILRRVVLRHPLRFLGSLVRHRTLSPSAAVLLMEGGKMHHAYRRAFRDAARRLGATVVAGSIILPENAAGLDADELQAAGNRLYNLSYTFAPDGRCVNVTRKVNLVPTLEDTLPLTPGCADDLTAIASPCGRVGVMICYDGFREPHTEDEPRFCALGPRLAAAGVEIIAQPSANPWPWNERWVFCASGEDQLRREQWLREGLFAQLPAMPSVRYAVNPQLIGDLLGTRFDGRSYVFGRDADGTARVIAAAARETLGPESEEILVARVPAPSAIAEAPAMSRPVAATPLPVDAAATPRLRTAARTS
jgi:predicted amidohydrolase